MFLVLAHPDPLVPRGPPRLGTSEATAIGLAMAFGASRPSALAATLMLRFSTLAVPCLIGVITLLRQKDLSRGGGGPNS